MTSRYYNYFEEFKREWIDNNQYLSNLDYLKKRICLENLAFMGTNVISGIAMAVVITTGNDTCIGTMADAITEKR